MGAFDDIIRKFTGTTSAVPTLQQIGRAMAPQTSSAPSPYANQAYRTFATPLQPAQEAQFQQWVTTNKIPFDPRPDPTSNYDMRGFFMDKAAMQERDARVAAGGSKHFPDTYKTPFHTTFSNESRYASPDAPHWNVDKLIDKYGATVADESKPSK